jgi:hypothetical protein
MSSSNFLCVTEPPLMLRLGIAHTTCCMGERWFYQPPSTSELNYHQALEAQAMQKSTLRTAYKMVRESKCRSNLTNQRYFDRKGKGRIFEAGDILYLFNPAKKRGRNSKFWCSWTGLCLLVEHWSKLNYQVWNLAGSLSCMSTA